jgi:hypothetical protein
MEQLLNSIDVDKTIGSVTLSDGVTSLSIPKISIKKIIQIVKFLGIDGAKLYSESREVLLDDSYEDLEKVAMILESLKEEQLVHIFSILLEIEDKQALELDINEMLDVCLVFVEKTNISKTFTQVRQLYKKMFKKELPDMKTIMNQMFPPIEEVDQKAKDMKEPATVSAGAK